MSHHVGRVRFDPAGEGGEGDFLPFHSPLPYVISAYLLLSSVRYTCHYSAAAVEATTRYRDEMFGASSLRVVV